MDKLNWLEDKYKIKNNKNRLRQLRKDFLKKNKLPIPVLSNKNGEFDYFLLLYNKHFDTVLKYDKFLETASDKGYFKESSDFIQEITQDVKDSGVSDDLNQLDLDNKELRDMQQELNILGKNILDPNNHNKTYISLDITQADYNTMKKVRPDFFNKDTFEEWVSRYDTENKYGHMNLRNIIFGHLNPKRQQKIQKQSMVKLMKNISGTVDVGFYVLGNDEIIMEYSKELDNKLDEIVSETEKETQYKFKKEVFQLEYMGYAELGYVKEYSDKKPKFVGVNKNFFAQSYKRYYNLKLTDNDLVFELESIPSKFLEPIHESK